MLVIKSEEYDISEIKTIEGMPNRFSHKSLQYRDCTLKRDRDIVLRAVVASQFASGMWMDKNTFVTARFIDHNCEIKGKHYIIMNRIEPILALYKVTLAGVHEKKKWTNVETNQLCTYVLQYGVPIAPAAAAAAVAVEPIAAPEVIVLDDVVVPPTVVIKPRMQQAVVAAPPQPPSPSRKRDRESESDESSVVQGANARTNGDRVRELLSIIDNAHSDMPSAKRTEHANSYKRMINGPDPQLEPCDYKTCYF